MESILDFVNNIEQSPEKNHVKTTFTFDEKGEPYVEFSYVIPTKDGIKEINMDTDTEDLSDEEKRIIDVLVINDTEKINYGTPQNITIVYYGIGTPTTEKFTSNSKSYDERQKIERLWYPVAAVSNEKDLAPGMKAYKLAQFVNDYKSEYMFDYEVRDNDYGINKHVKEIESIGAVLNTFIEAAQLRMLDKETAEIFISEDTQDIENSNSKIFS